MRFQKAAKHICLLILLFSASSVIAAGGTEFAISPWESQRYLIEGVYYLINEGDLDTAENMFRKAILSVPFGSLSRIGDDQDTGKQIAAEAFYFLGEIHYKRAMLHTGKEDRDLLSPGIENIAWAKKYLGIAEEYGIVYDRLHPPLLDKISREYPKILAKVVETNRDKSKVIIETNHTGSYKVDAIKVDQYSDVTKSTLLTGKEFDLECGARYKVKPDIQGSYNSIYRALAIFGIGLLIWVTRS